MFSPEKPEALRTLYIGPLRKTFDFKSDVERLLAQLPFRDKIEKFDIECIKPAAQEFAVFILMKHPVFARRLIQTPVNPLITEEMFSRNYIRFELKGQRNCGQQWFSRASGIEIAKRDQSSGQMDASFGPHHSTSSTVSSGQRNQICYETLYQGFCPRPSCPKLHRGERFEVMRMVIRAQRDVGDFETRRGKGTVPPCENFSVHGSCPFGNQCGYQHSEAIHRRFVELCSQQAMPQPAPSFAAPPGVFSGWYGFPSGFPPQYIPHGRGVVRQGDRLRGASVGAPPVSLFPTSGHETQSSDMSRSKSSSYLGASSGSLHVSDSTEKLVEVSEANEKKEEEEEEEEEANIDNLCDAFDDLPLNCEELPHTPQLSDLTARLQKYEVEYPAPKREMISKNKESVGKKKPSDIPVENESDEEYTTRSSRSSSMSDNDLRQWRKWGIEDVMKWVVSLRPEDESMNSESSLFEKHRITGVDLVSLDANTLRDEIGVASFGHRNAILSGIEELKNWYK